VISALVVPVLNRPDLLQRMLASIDHPVEHLAIIDNGHVLPPGKQVVENVQRTHVITMPWNLGVAGSWNLGIKSLPFAPWWLIVNSDAHFPPGSLARMEQAARPDALVMSAASPRWACFALGEDVVRRVGLFDEALHPAYFEDNDYTRRCEAAGVPIVHTGIPVHHDNSSTLAGGYQRANDRSFPANHAYYADKVARGDLSAGEWSLDRRRDLSWD
jgi:GT2 family glycosyltransferase